MDIYDQAIKFLKENSSQIVDIWDDPKSHWSGVLFQAVTPSGKGENNILGEYCGDICEIKSLQAMAWTDELSNEIAKDARIPRIYASNGNIPIITEDLLSVFAEWQRKIDLQLGRNPENFECTNEQKA